MDSWLSVLGWIGVVKMLNSKSNKDSDAERG